MHKLEKLRILLYRGMDKGNNEEIIKLSQKIDREILKYYMNIKK
jgi:hypothetical protein